MTAPNFQHDASVAMGAREFHSQTGITKQLRDAEQAFRKRFVDAETGRVKSQFVFKRHCPLCGEGTGQLIFMKNGFEHRRCDCGMIYVPEVLKEEYLNLVYAGDEFEEETHRGFREEPRKSFILAIYQDGMELLNRCGVTHGFLFDVGCSSGLFMEFAAGQGFEVKGIEPSVYAVEMARRHGIDVAQGYFHKDLLPNNSVDIITMWDVLEHCEHPDEILDAAFAALKPGGKIFIQVPNAMGLAPRILRQACNMFTGFGHINLFGPATLIRLLENHRFQTPEMQSVISEISVINNYLGYHDPYHGPSLDRERILGIIDVDTIQKNLWGYKLQVVAHKAQ